MLWLLRRGVAGYVKNATASVFTLVYVPFLASFVALLLGEGGTNPAFGFDTDDPGVRGVITFIAITAAMTPRITPTHQSPPRNDVTSHTPTAVVAAREPAKPSHDFFGEITGAIGCLPKSTPAT